jgi:hypothetical protein
MQCPPSEGESIGVSRHRPEEVSIDGALYRSQSPHGRWKHPAGYLYMRMKASPESTGMQAKEYCKINHVIYMPLAECDIFMVGIYHTRSIQMALVPR